jgi:hypothetical protein
MKTTCIQEYAFGKVPKRDSMLYRNFVTVHERKSDYREVRR